MPGLFAGTSLERPVTCAVCEQPLDACRCPRDAAGNVLPPEKQTAVVRMEKRGKGKVVTVISGLDPVANDLLALLKQLKGLVGAGGNVEGGAIELQGDHREKIAAKLREMKFKVQVG